MSTVQNGRRAHALTSNVCAFLPLCLPSMCSCSLARFEVHRKVCRHTLHCSGCTDGSGYGVSSKRLAQLITPLCGMPYQKRLCFGVGLRLAGCRAVCGKGISNIAKPRSKADMLQPCILQMYMRMRAKHSLPPLAVLAAFSWAFCRAIAVFCALPPPCFNIHSEVSPKAMVCHAPNAALRCVARPDGQEGPHDAWE
jgi:hypothetical protein